MRDTNFRSHKKKKRFNYVKILNFNMTKDSKNKIKNK